MKLEGSYSTGLSDGEVRVFNDILSQRPICLRGGQDVLRWCGSGTSSYSAKVGYSILSKLQE